MKHILYIALLLLISGCKLDKSNSVTKEITKSTNKDLELSVQSYKNSSKTYDQNDLNSPDELQKFITAEGIDKLVESGEIEEMAQFPSLLPKYGPHITQDMPKIFHAMPEENKENIFNQFFDAAVLQEDNEKNPEIVLKAVSKTDLKNIKLRDRNIHNIINQAQSLTTKETIEPLVKAGYLEKLWDANIDEQVIGELNRLRDLSLDIFTDIKLDDDKLYTFACHSFKHNKPLPYYSTNDKLFLNTNSKIEIILSIALDKHNYELIKQYARGTSVNKKIVTQLLVSKLNFSEESPISFFRQTKQQLESVGVTLESLLILDVNKYPKIEKFKLLLRDDLEKELNLDGKENKVIINSIFKLLASNKVSLKLNELQISKLLANLERELIKYNLKFIIQETNYLSLALFIVKHDFAEQFAISYVIETAKKLSEPQQLEKLSTTAFSYFSKHYSKISKYRLNSSLERDKKYNDIFIEFINLWVPDYALGNFYSFTANKQNMSGNLLYIKVAVTKDFSNENFWENYFATFKKLALHVKNDLDWQNFSQPAFEFLVTVRSFSEEGANKMLNRVTIQN